MLQWESLSTVQTRIQRKKNRVCYDSDTSGNICNNSYFYVKLISSQKCRKEEEERAYRESKLYIRMLDEKIKVNC